MTTTKEKKEDVCMKAEILAEHKWLDQMLGDWTYEHECNMGPDSPPIKSTGTESAKSIGGLWVQSEGKGSMPDGSPATTVMTLGYDPRIKRFVGTFIGSMMTHLWNYEGELDASKKILTLNAEGPSFASPDKLSKYQDIIEIVDNDHRILRSQLQTDDGKWTPFMVGHYYRKK